MSTNSEKLYNDLWINQWADMEKYNPTAQHLKLIINKYLKNSLPVDSLLDVGSGMGYNLLEIKKKYPSIKLTGTELTNEINQLARSFTNNKDIEFKTLNLEKKNLNQKFDFVLCNQVLEHINDDVTAIKNLSQMVKKYLLITVPSGRYNKTSELVGHIRHYKLDDLISKVKATNLQIIECFEWGHPFHSIYKTLLNFLPKEKQKKIGFGKYGILKKLIAKSLFLLFYLNSSKKGENIILFAKKNEI